MDFLLPEPLRYQLNRTWEPFRLLEAHETSIPPRPMGNPKGIIDRLCAAAMAELQARDAFLWGAQTFQDVPSGLIKGWNHLVHEEDKHLNWLLGRLKELNVDLSLYPQSDRLWKSLLTCTSGKQFAVFMATAEERGRRAGERFREQMKLHDPESARIFGQIALEEESHIRLVETFFPEEQIRNRADGGHQRPLLPNPPSPRSVAGNSSTQTG